MDKKSEEYASIVFANLFLSLTRLQTAGDKVDPSITMKQWLLIAVIMKSENRTLTALGKQLGCSRQNVKKLAQPLIRSGFLMMESDENDARAVKVKLTDDCLRHLKKRESYETSFMELLFSDFSIEDLETFMELMQKYFAGIERIEHKLETGELIMK